MERMFGSVLCAALIAIGCTQGVGGSPKPVGEEIVLGAPVSLTGSTSAEGNLVRQGYELWLDWINGRGGIEVKGVMHRVRIQYQDDQSKPAVSAQATEDLITQQGVRFMLGPYGSSNAVADAAVSEKLQVPTVEGNAAARAVYSKRYVFGVLSPADKYLESVLDMLVTRTPKPTTIAILSADDSFSTETARTAAAYAPTKGMQVVFNQQYPSGSSNLYPVLSQVKPKNPDVVLNAGHGLEAIAISKAARDLRLDAKVFAYTVGPATPEFLQSLGKEANYVYTSAQWSPEVRYKPSMYLSAQAYVAAYQKKFGTQDDPAYIVAESTAACLALETAIENAASLDREKVRAALATLDINTFFGRIKFDEQGINAFKPMVVLQIQDMRRVTVWPPEVAVAQPAYPTPAWTVRLGLPPNPPPPAKLPGTGHPRR
jgi:branched-chain amino acid transport system substrate-binding protein